MSKQQQGTAAANQAATKPAVRKVRKKVARSVPAGLAHVKATFNNTLVTITDPAGNVVAWSSSGNSGYSGSRKSSAFAATVAAQNAGKQAMSNVGMKEIEVLLNGPGAGRESAVRGLQSSGLIVTVVRDCTPLAHNGCRARKRRRA